MHNKCKCKFVKGKKHEKHSEIKVNKTNSLKIMYKVSLCIFSEIHKEIIASLLKARLTGIQAFQLLMWPCTISTELYVAYRLD